MVTEADSNLIVSSGDIKAFTTTGSESGTDISFRILDDADDVNDLGYYVIDGLENDHWTSVYNNSIKSTVEYIMGGEQSDFYSVSFLDVANINFVNADSNNDGDLNVGEENGEIVIGQLDSSYTTFSGEPNTYGFTNTYATDADQQGDIWFQTPSNSNVATAQMWAAGFGRGSVGHYAIMHEIGHALGLSHTFYEPSDVSKLAADGTNIDNLKYSIMSYDFMAGSTGTSYANSVAPTGLQLLDIAALQDAYGANYTIRNELLDSDPNTTGTTYKMGSNQAFGVSATDKFIYTIWDGGGTTDTIDAAGYSDGVIIDLREGGFSSIGKAANSSYVGERGTGLADFNVAIAFGSTIENAVGTAHADHLIGNYSDNVLIGGANNDVLDGGHGYDTVDYSTGASGVTVDLKLRGFGDGDDTAYAGTDTFTSIEKLIGTAFDDEIEISSYIQGYTVDGGGGSDHAILNFSGRDIGVIIDANGDIRTGNGDVITNVETVELSNGFYIAEAMGRSYSAGSTNGNSIDISYAQQTDAITANFSTGQISNVNGMDSISSFPTESGDVIVQMKGTNAGDTYILDADGGFELLRLHSGTGGDIIQTDDGTNLIYIYSGGNDVFTGDVSYDNSYGIYLPDNMDASDIDIEFSLQSTIEEYQTTYGTNPSVAGLHGVYKYNIKVTIDSDTANTITFEGVKVIRDFPAGQIAFYDVGQLEHLQFLSFDSSSSETKTYKFDVIGAIADLDDMIANTISSSSATEAPYSNYYQSFGDDTLTGGAGTDYLHGEFGNDTLDGKGGIDYVSGGSGNDTFTYTFSENTGNIDYYYAGTGTDTLKLYLTAVEYSFAQPELDAYQEYLSVYADPTKNGMTVTTSTGVVFSDFEILKVYVDGVLQVPAINGTASNDALSGTAGDDVINGLAGLDIIDGLTGNDILNGDDGNDTLIGGAGDDDLDGGDGIDTADYSAATSWVKAQLMNATASNDGEGGADTFTSIENLVGSAYADKLWGDSNDNVIYGGAGHDKIYVRDGVNTVYGGANNDTIDALYSITGNNTLYGEANNDTFVMGASGSSFMDGGTGNNTITYAYVNTAITVDVATGSIDKNGDSIADDTFTNIRSIIGSSANDTMTGSAATDYLKGHSGDDVISGGGSYDSLNGQNGNDTLYGGDGNDSLYGGNGDDILYGQDGNDLMYGQAGADTFVFENATAFNITDRVQDFSLSDNDKLDISDLLAAYDPLNDVLTDFVQITDSGVDSIVSVDADGGADGFVQIAKLFHITGLTDEVALEAGGHLVV